MTKPIDANVSELDDEQLLLRDRDGDPRAFDLLVERHASRVMTFTLRATGDRTAAQDLLQETFLRAYRAREKFKGKGTFSAWLLTIARNLVNDRFRWLGRWKMVPLEDEEPLPVHPLRVVPRDPEEEAVSAETHQELREALLRLPEPQREVLLLSRFGGMSYTEIAMSTGSTEEAVKQKAYRGLLGLKKEMNRTGTSARVESHEASVRRQRP